MADEQESADPKPAGLNRGSIGILVAIQILFAWILFVGINYLSGTHHKAWDLSQEKEFTLSAQTHKLLESDLLQDRGTPVKIIAAVRKSLSINDQNAAAHSNLGNMLLSEEKPGEAAESYRAALAIDLTAPVSGSKSGSTVALDVGKNCI